MHDWQEVLLCVAYAIDSPVDEIWVLSYVERGKGSMSRERLVSLSVEASATIQ